MTVSDFACSMCDLDLYKTPVSVIRNGEVLCECRMERLRYAHEDFPKKMAFAGEEIMAVSMMAGSFKRVDGISPDYIVTIIV